MKNDNVRDYVTSAFRFYAREGGPEKYKAKLKKQIEERIKKSEGCSTDVSKPTEAFLMKVEAELDCHKAEFEDLKAVEVTKQRIKLSSLKNKELIWPVLERVYMAEPDKPLKRNEITNRVIKCDIDLAISPASTYRYLANARYIFALERGLRVEKD